MASRKLNVQTPGATAPTPTDAPAANPASPEKDVSGGVSRDEQVPNTPEPPAAPARKPKAPAAPAPESRLQYAQIAAADINPEKLTAPVLSRDGWVCPVKKVV